MPRHIEGQHNEGTETRMVAKFGDGRFVFAISELPTAAIARETRPARRKETAQRDDRMDDKADGQHETKPHWQCTCRDRKESQDNDDDRTERKAPRRHEVKGDGRCGFHR